MPFGIGKDLSVLEAKFQIYEDLSKEMLDKLERAVDKISESNQNVALILERHENRLDQVDKTESALLELIKDLKDKIKEIEKKLEEVSQIKWMTLGCGVVLAVVCFKPPCMCGCSASVHEFHSMINNIAMML